MVELRLDPRAPHVSVRTREGFDVKRVRGCRSPPTTVPPIAYNSGQLPAMVEYCKDYLISNVEGTDKTKHRTAFLVQFEGLAVYFWHGCDCLSLQRIHPVEEKS